MLLHVDSSRYPEEIRKRTIAALNAGRLPASFLYDSAAQAHRWLVYHQAYSPSRVSTELQTLYARAFACALRITEKPHIQYVSLGSGGGRKDAQFLRTANFKNVVFTATDASHTLVLETLLATQGLSATSTGRVIDLLPFPNRAQLELGEMPAIFSAFGIVPNFELSTFLSGLRQNMHPTDVAIVSANLAPNMSATCRENIRRQYDNPEARNWYSGALLELGLTTEDYQLTVTTENMHAQAWRVRCLATFRRDVRQTIYGHSFFWPQGSQLEVFYSQRWTDAQFSAELESHHFRIVERELLTSGEEGIYLLVRAQPNQASPCA